MSIVGLEVIYGRGNKGVVLDKIIINGTTHYLLENDINQSLEIISVQNITKIEKKNANSEDRFGGY